LDTARRLFKESTHSHGFRQPLYFIGTYAPVAQYVAKAVRPLGIDFELREVDMGRMDQLLFSQGAPAFILQFTFPTVDSSDVLYFGFHTMTADRSYGVLNFSGFSDPRLDTILERSSAEMDLLGRYELLKEGMRIAMESNVWVPLSVRLNIFAASKKIHWLGNIRGHIILEEIKLRH